MNHADPTVKFLRVMGIRSTRPTVLAVVDGYLVSWDTRGWACQCDEPDDSTCDHVEIAAAHLDPRVTGGAS